MKYLLTAAMVLIAALGIWHKLNQEPAPTKSYAFNIPVLVLDCINFDLVEGETFGNFEIHQPVVFSITNGSILHHSLIHVGAWCGDYVVKAYQPYRMHDLSFDGARIQ